MAESSRKSTKSDSVDRNSSALFPCACFVLENAGAVPKESSAVHVDYEYYVCTAAICRYFMRRRNINTVNTVYYGTVHGRSEHVSLWVSYNTVCWTSIVFISFFRHSPTGSWHVPEGNLVPDMIRRTWYGGIIHHTRDEQEGASSQAAICSSRWYCRTLPLILSVYYGTVHGRTEHECTSSFPSCECAGRCLQQQYSNRSTAVVLLYQVYTRCAVHTGSCTKCKQVVQR